MDNLGENVWCLADIEASSAQIEVRDWKKIVNKSDIITTKWSDINKSAKLQGAWEIPCYRGVSRLHNWSSKPEGGGGIF